MECGTGHSFRGRTGPGERGGARGHRFSRRASGVRSTSSLDLYLVGAVYDLALGNLGLANTLLASVAGALGLGLVTWVLARLLKPVGGKASRLVPRLGGVALIALFALGLAQGSSAPWLGDQMALPAVELAKEQAEQFRRTLIERKSFAAELAASPRHLRGNDRAVGEACWRGRAC